MAVALVLALAGCGRHDSAANSFADTIATSLQADCLQKPSGTARAVQLRKQLCGCTAEKIRAGKLKASDGDKVNEDKIHAVQQACRQQAYGRDR